MGQWEGFAGGWAFEKVLEICRRVKTVPLKPKGTAPELVQPARVCATRLGISAVQADQDLLYDVYGSLFEFFNGEKSHRQFSREVLLLLGSATLACHCPSLEVSQKVSCMVVTKRLPHGIPFHDSALVGELSLKRMATSPISALKRHFWH